MEIHTIIYFNEVAKTLNYTKAAEKCFITRQALRQQISSLEKEVGEPLLINAHNHLGLTQVGLRFLEKIQPIIKEYGKLQDFLLSVHEERKTFTLGVCSSMVPFQFELRNEDIEEFEKKFRTKMEVEFYTMNECFKRLEENQVDCVYIFQLDDEISPYIKTPVVILPVYFTCSAELEISNDILDVEDLLSYHFMGMGDAELTYPPLVRDLKKQGKSLDYELSLNTIETFYKAGRNEGVLLDLKNDEYPLPGLRHIPVNQYQWYIGLLSKRVDPLIVELSEILRKNYPLKV